MPVALFERFAPDTTALWRWARTARPDVDPTATPRRPHGDRSILPDLLTVETWLRRHVAGHPPTRVRT